MSLLLLVLRLLVLRLLSTLGLLLLLLVLRLLSALRLLLLLRGLLLNPLLLWRLLRALGLLLLCGTSLRLSLLVLPAALFLPIALPVALCVHGDHRGEKQEGTSGTDPSRESQSSHWNKSHGLPFPSTKSQIRRHSSIG